ncbi:MAG TPA: 7TM diverse intracellular signaling domain-containing protein [Candidatus Hydrogenedentes bacterium]|nr:7TM diverse intracellular signaling domain-containing protein [Candidatus Hydrogenedentota bacterium]
MAVVWAAVVVPPQEAAAAPVISLESNCRERNVTDRLEFLVDTSDALTIEDMARPEIAAGFAACEAPFLNLGVISQILWLRFTLVNEAATDKEWVVELQNPRILNAEFFTPMAGGGYHVECCGIAHSFFDRPYLHPSPAFRVRLSAGETRTCHVRIEHTGAVILRVVCWSAAAFRTHSERWSALVILYAGILVALALNNLVTFLGLYERAYLYCTLMILAFCLYEMAFNGSAQKFLWPNQPWWADHSITVLYATALAMAILFAQSFVRSAQHAPWLHRVANVLIGACIVLLILGFTDFRVKYMLGTLLGLAAPAVVVLLSWRCWRAGYGPARLFALAWAMVLVGTTTLILTGLGLLPPTMPTENSLALCFLAGLTLWSLGLALRVKNNEEANRRILETKVEERTAELRKAMTEMRTLSGLLPICAHCKKIRDDRGYWANVETYISEHSDAGFSHSICPECARKYFPGIMAEIDAEASRSPEIG